MGWFTRSAARPTVLSGTESFGQKIERWRAWFRQQPKLPSVDAVQAIEAERQRRLGAQHEEEVARQIALHGYYWPNDGEDGPTVTHGPDGSTWIRF